jgi:hypothetical protein
MAFVFLIHLMGRAATTEQQYLSNQRTIPSYDLRCNQPPHNMARKMEKATAIAPSLIMNSESLFPSSLS